MSKIGLTSVAAKLSANGMETTVVSDTAAARQAVLGIIPEGARVMTMTSVTLDSLDLPRQINDSGKYYSVRKELLSLDRDTQSLQVNKLGSAPDYAVGSVHAVTASGQVIIASNTGSQLPAYAYGATHVIWVVGRQKIVTNLNAAFKRIYDHILPLESERANKAYGITTGSFVSKLLIINREIKPGRIKIILVRQELGF